MKREDPNNKIIGEKRDRHWEKFRDSQGHSFIKLF